LAFEFESSPGVYHKAVCLLLSALLLGSCSVQPETEPVTSATGSVASGVPSETGSAVNLSESDVDTALQQVATGALGEREGTIIVMDPRNGRLRAIVNPRLAFEQAFPPGSAIKPFTALTALQTGLIDGESRMACGGHYTH